MFRPRIIPVLLLKGQGLVKSIRFNKYRYIGDPINAVKLFNDLQADELVFLDIEATKQNRSVSLDFVKRIGEEANMPFAVGGGISTIKEIQAIIAAGAEKVIINTAAGLNPDFISEAANTFGSTTIVVCIDIKKSIFGKERIWIKSGRKAIQHDPVEYAKLIALKGAGEIIVQSIDRDGMMNGYDIDMLTKISKAVAIPVVALGGAGKLADFAAATRCAGCSAVAAGSLFVYHGERKGILINYPSDRETKRDLV